MKSKSVVMFVVALLFATGATFFANRWLDTMKPAIQKSQAATTEMIGVVVAAIPIQQFQKIEAANVKVVPWAKGNTPEGFIGDVSAVVGKFVNQTIQPNEPILQSRITDTGKLSSNIPEGKRAVSMRVNDVSGVSGYVLPGTRVDVIAAHRECETTTKDKVETCRITSRLVLEDVKVLAVDQYAATEGSEPKLVKTVTLELSPAEVQTLVKEGVGSDNSKDEIRLALRNGVTDKPVTVSSRTQERKVYRNGNTFSDTSGPGFKEYEPTNRMSVISGRSDDEQETIDRRFKSTMAVVMALQGYDKVAADIEGQRLDNQNKAAELRLKELTTECESYYFQHTMDHNNPTLRTRDCSQPQPREQINVSNTTNVGGSGN